MTPRLNPLARLSVAPGSCDTAPAATMPFTMCLLVIRIHAPLIWNSISVSLTIRSDHGTDHTVTLAQDVQFAIRVHTHMDIRAAARNQRGSWQSPRCAATRVI